MPEHWHALPRRALLVSILAQKLSKDVNCDSAESDRRTNTQTHRTDFIPSTADEGGYKKRLFLADMKLIPKWVCVLNYLYNMIEAILDVERNYLTYKDMATLSETLCLTAKCNVLGRYRMGMLSRKLITITGYLRLIIITD